MHFINLDHSIGYLSRIGGEQPSADARCLPAPPAPPALLRARRPRARPPRRRGCDGGADVRHGLHGLNGGGRSQHAGRHGRRAGGGGGRGRGGGAAAAAAGPQLQRRATVHRRLARRALRRRGALPQGHPLPHPARAGAPGGGGGPGGQLRHHRGADAAPHALLHQRVPDGAGRVRPAVPARRVPALAAALPRPRLHGGHVLLLLADLALHPVAGRLHDRHLHLADGGLHRGAVHRRLPPHARPAAVHGAACAPRRGARLGVLCGGHLHRALGAQHRPARGPQRRAVRHHGIKPSGGQRPVQDAVLLGQRDHLHAAAAAAARRFQLLPHQRRAPEQAGAAHHDAERAPVRVAAPAPGEPHHHHAHRRRHPVPGVPDARGRHARLLHLRARLPHAARPGQHLQLPGGRERGLQLPALLRAVRQVPEDISSHFRPLVLQGAGLGAAADGLHVLDALRLHADDPHARGQRVPAGTQRTQWRRWWWRWWRYPAAEDAVGVLVAVWRRRRRRAEGPPLAQPPRAARPGQPHAAARRQRQRLRRPRLRLAGVTRSQLVSPEGALAKTEWGCGLAAADVLGVQLSLAFITEPVYPVLSFSSYRKEKFQYFSMCTALLVA